MADNSVLTRVWRFIIIASFVLGVVGVAGTLYLTNKRVDDLATRRQESAQQTCERQKDTSHIWHGVLAEIEKQSAEQGRPLSPSYIQFRDGVYKVVDQFPACKLVK